MAKFDEVFGAYNSQKNNTWRSRQRLYDDVFGKVEEPEAESRESREFGGIGDILLRGAANVFTGLEAPLGAGLKALGAEFKGIAEEADAKDNPYLSGAVYRGIGNFADSAGDYFEGRAFSPERQKALTAQEWNEINLADLIGDPEKRAQYASDPNGLFADLTFGLGNAGYFASLAKLFPSGAATGVASKILNPASGLLGKTGLERLSKVVGSDAAKELVGSGLQFGATMGPAGAITNAGTIVDSLREQGLSDAEIKSKMNSLIGEELPADIAFSALTGNVAKGQLGRLAPRGSSTWQKALANSLGIPLEGAGGYYSNVNQMILADKYGGKPYGTLENPLPNESAAGRMGALAGMPFAAHGAYRGTRDAQIRDQIYEQEHEEARQRSKDYADRYYSARSQAPDLSREALRETIEETYTGENGAGEGKTWFRQGNASLEGAQPNLLNAVDMLADWLYKKTGRRLVVTSGTDGHSHTEGDHSHYSGWKVDVVDEYVDGEDSDLITADFQKGKLADEFIAYGRSLGLGMNFEDAGSNNVHFDIALDGTQWDGNGEDAGGFNPQNADTTKKYSFDPDFSEKQNEIWQLAQYASQRAKRKYDYDIPPELIYKQWAHEAGANFDSENAQYNNNFGGLTQVEPNGEENKQPDGSNYYRHFDSVKDYADAYVDDFIKYYPEINGVKNEREFASVLKQYDYFGDDLENYAKSMEGISAPKTLARRVDEKFAQKIQGVMNPRSQRPQGEESPASPLFDMSGEDEATQKLFEQFANERRNYETGIEFFAPMFVNDEFQNTKENRDAMRKRYPQTFNAWAQAALSEKSKSQPAQPNQVRQRSEGRSAGTVNDPLITVARKHLEQLNEENKPDKKLVTLQLSNALNAGDRVAIKNILAGDNVAVPEAEPTQKPVQGNTSSEGALPKVKISAEEKRIKIARKPVREGRNNKPSRIKQGKAIAELATQSGIEIPQAEIIALQNGSIKAVQKWRDNLLQAGVLKTVSEQSAQPQTQSPTKRPEEAPPQTTLIDELQEKEDFAYQDAIDAAIENWDAIKQNAQARGDAIQKERREAAEEAADMNELTRSIKDDALEDRLFADDVREAQNTRDEQAELIRRAKQDKELAELEARQAEAKRLREASAKRSAEQKRLREEEALEEKTNLIAGNITKAISSPNDSEDTRSMAKVAMAVPVKNKGAQNAQGYALRQILSRLIDKGLVEGSAVPNGLIIGLENGSMKAIARAQEIVEDAITDERLEAAEITPTAEIPKEPPAQQPPAKAEQMQQEKRTFESETLDARINDLADADYQETLQQPKLREAENMRQAEHNQRRKIFDEVFSGVGEAQSAAEQTPKRKAKTSSNAEQLREKLKEAATPDGKKARNYLNHLKTKELNDEQLSNAEERLKRSRENYEKTKRETQARTDGGRGLALAVLDRAHKESNQRLDFEPLPETFRESKADNYEKQEKPSAGEKQAALAEEQKPELPEKPASEELAGEEPRKEIGGIVGDEDEARTSTDAEYPVRYKVVEAEDLLASHDLTDQGVFSNPEYIERGGIQPRDRQTTELQQRLYQQAINFNPKRLLEMGSSVNDGAPVIRKDGVVFNGNGRIAVVKYIYNHGRGDEYKNLLIKRAARYGLAAERIADMREPVLVRELSGDLSRAELEDIAGTTEGGAASIADERATSDAKKISPETLARFPAKENVELTAAEAGDFVHAVLKDISTNDEFVALEKNGKVSEDGLARVKRALFALAYPDKKLVETMAVSTDDNVRNVTSALENAAAEFAKVRMGIENGSLADYNLNEITDAAIKLSALREEGKKVKDYLREGKLVEEDTKAFRETLSALDNFGRSKVKLTKFLQQIARRIQAQGERSDAGSLFEMEPPELEDIVKQARNAVENGGNVALFDKTGDVAENISNVVEDKDLTLAQKLLKSFGEKLGVETFFVNNPDSRFHGMFRDGKIYLNVNSAKSLGKVFWHESLHWLKANNPTLYKSLVKATGITDAQRENYLKETARDDLTTNGEIDEEILADAMEDTAKRTGLLQNIAGKNRGLIERLVQWLKDTMNKFVDHFRNPQGKLTTKQAQALADEFGKIARNLTDADGKKIFRYNRGTHNIELADGRELGATLTEKGTAAATPQLEGNAKYSIGNDNSGQSLTQAIKAKVSALFSSDTPAKRRNVRITQAVSKLTGCRVAFGHMTGDETIIDDFHKVIRSPHAYEWEKLLPKIGGKIAQNLGISNPSKEMSNYVADWLLNGALNNTTAEATQFQKAMRENPEMAELMQEVRDIFQEVADMSPSEKILSKVVKPQKNSMFSKRDFKEQWTDDLHPLKRAIDQMIEKAPPEIAAFMKEHIKPYEMARLLRGMGGVANMMIDTAAKDVEKLRGALQELYPYINFSKFQSIRAIVDSVGGDIEGLQAYAIAKLDKEIHEKNREKNPDGSAKYKYVKPTYSEADDDAVIKAGEKKFGEAHKALVHYSKTLLKMMYASGLITQSHYVKLNNKWQNYIPMARVFDENEGFFEIDSLQEKVGSDRDIYAPINTILSNTHEILRRCESNKVKLELATYVRCGGFGEIFSEIDKPSPNDGTVIRFMENGKRKYLQTPDLSIVRAVENIYQKSDSAWLMKMLKSTMSLMRNLFTASNPDFAVGNIFRDVADAYIHNRYAGNPITAFLDVWRKGLKGVLEKDQAFHDWIAHGGSQSAFVSEDVDYSQRSIDDITGGTRAQLYRKNFFSQALKDVQKISEYSEYATRLSNYKTALQKLAAQRADGKATIEDKKRAALESRNASIDFAKAGTSMRKFNRVVLFSNAAVQGWALDAKTFDPRQLKTKDGRKKFFAAAFRLAMIGIMPALAQVAFNNSDDERKKLYENRPEWEKDTYWIFGDVRIPKGVDVGIRLLSTLTDEFLSDNPMEARRIGKTFYDALPSILPTIVAPAFEVWANYSFFRDAPIVPYKEQKLPDRLQYGENTSSVAKMFGDLTGLSPRKTDYLISGYLGFLGKFFSRVLDYAGGNRALGIDEIPLVRRFMFDPYKNPKVVQDYYEAYNEQEKFLAGYKLEREQGKKIALPEDYDAALHKRLKAANEQMKKLSKREKKILEAPNLTSDERTEKLRELEKIRMWLCERALGRAR